MKIIGRGERNSVIVSMTKDEFDAIIEASQAWVGKYTDPCMAGNDFDTSQLRANGRMVRNIRDLKDRAVKLSEDVVASVEMLFKS